MKQVKSLVYRYLTNADFFNIYKPPGAEEGGGGQTYIDFPTSTIQVQKWEEFFSGVSGMQVDTRAQGPAWTIPVHSVAAPLLSQELTMYLRRPQSVCIAAQHIHGRNANRVKAWHPEHGFPEPRDPRDRHQLQPGLVVFLVRTYDNEIWAGWHSSNGAPPHVDSEAAELLEDMLAASDQPGSSGLIQFEEASLLMDESSRDSPFRSTPGAAVKAHKQRGKKEKLLHAKKKIRAKSRRTPHHRTRSEKEILKGLFDEDQTSKQKPRKRRAVLKILDRNTKAVRSLKQLYGHKCQITGDVYSFKARDGKDYTEAHHLIPLGKGGADGPRNIIIVNPLVHRMLHYARVSGIDLDNIKIDDEGYGTLAITINEKPFTIRWHPQHAEQIQKTRAKNL